MNPFLSKIDIDGGLVRRCLLSTLMLVSACSDEVKTTNASAIDTKSVEWQRVLDALDLPDEPVADIVMPDDIRAHPESPFESFEIRAVLRNETGQWIGLSGQIDRLQVTNKSDAQSAWAFDSIARASISGAGKLTPTLTTREELSRVALNLANSTPEEIHVRDTRYTFIDKGQCKGSIHVQGRDALNENYSLVGKPSTCPQSVSSSFVNQWEFPAIAIQGNYATESVRGHMWLTHRWGNAVLPGGAVLLDQVRIQLLAENKTLWLTVNRTKRASGRGPRTIAALISEDQETYESVNVEWEDQGEQISAVTQLSYPQTVVLKIPSKGYELTLRPIIELPEVQDSLGTRWSGAVTVTQSGSGRGSDTLSGTGFLDYQPLSLKE